MEEACLYSHTLRPPSMLKKRYSFLYTLIKSISLTTVKNTGKCVRNLLFLFISTPFFIPLAHANQAPNCESAYASPDSLWPPNHAFKTIKIKGISDPDGGKPDVVIQCIHQDEPTNSVGDGNTEHDASGIGTNTLKLRRERSGEGNGRVYHVSFLAKDSAGAECQGSINIQVPLNKKGTAIDDGSLYESVPQQGDCSGTPVNNPPVFNSFPVTNATSTLEYTYDADATDPDGDILEYSLLHAPSGMSIDATTGVINWTPTDGQIGDHTVDIQVTDSGQETDTQNYTLSVTPLPNTPPDITSEPITSASTGNTYSYDVEASDADLDALVFTLSVFPAGMSIDDASGLIHWVPTTAQIGDHSVSVHVTDVRDGSVNQDFIITVTQSNSAPVITSTAPIQATATLAYSYDVEASDGDGDILSYSLNQAPTGMTIEAMTGLINWLPEVAQQGLHTVEVRVEDGQDSSNQTFILEVLPRPNNAPNITSQAISEAFAGIPYQYEMDATDPDAGDVLSFELSTAPTGMTIDNLTGVIQWQPSIHHLGLHDVTAVVSDTGGLSDSQSFVITVIQLNSAPTITSNAITTGTEGSPYSYQVLASDLDGNNLDYVLPVAPSGMSIDTQSGLIQWVPNFDQSGAHLVTVQVNDGLGLSDTQSYELQVSNTNRVPVIHSIAATSGEVGTAYSYQVQASDADGDSITFSLMTAPLGMTVNSETGLITWVPTTVGEYSAELKASDSQGEYTTQPFNISVITHNEIPQVSILTPANLTEVDDGDLIQFSGVSNDLEDGDLSHLIQWTSNLQGALGNGNQLIISLAVGTHTISASSIDSAGLSNTTDITLTVSEINLPEEPSAVAPPLASSEVTSFIDSTSFLYTGANPIQAGVNPTDIDYERAALLRGRVLNGSDTPLPGVTIRVKDHPEFGQTLSRADGLFDLVVNGGETLVIEYQRGGYLPAQRTIDIAWGASANLEDVVLLGLDPQVTTVNLSDTSHTFIVAQGSQQTDADGTRQATVLFPSGTQATMTLADGSTQSLTTLNVRATEYTLGENGGEAMPGPLPIHSGYTYAVELSVDEAIVANASRVDFSQTLPVYVDNFLNFPAGEIVPSGWYDRENAVWVPSENGRVIKILTINAGVAELDLDGSGIAATASALLALGITTDEQIKLAELYSIGKTLWRVPVTHFTPWDFNWPWGLPEDAITPLEEKPELLDEDTPDPEDNNECEGCIIEAQSQTLGEDIPLVGTSQSLHYRSSRVKGRKTRQSMIVPLTGDSIPSSLRSVSLRIEAAGQVQHLNFAPQENLSHTYLWNGLDGFGREVNATTAKITVSYHYNLVYYPARADFTRSFGMLAAGTTGIANRAAKTGAFSRTWYKKLVNHMPDSAGLGAWTLSAHHTYDPATKFLYLGNGDKRTAASLGDVVYTVAGNGTRGAGEDDIPALETSLEHIADIAFGADGSMYIAEFARIRKIGTDGIIRTVAGNGIEEYSGDGGLATEASLSRALGIAVAGDGTLYIADALSHRVRMVNTDGIISTIAGTGEAGFNGDGIPATEANLYRPASVALSSDGSVYIADSLNARVRRITPDGIIHTVAGDGAYGNFEPDNVLATNTQVRYPTVLDFALDGSLYILQYNNYSTRRVDASGIITRITPIVQSSAVDGVHLENSRFRELRDIAFGPDGSLYFADFRNYRIRKAAPNGIVTTLAGTGVREATNDPGIANGGLALNEDVVNALVAVDPQGDVYYIKNNRIRKVTSALPGISQENTIIPSRSGKQLYVFNSQGRHLTTLDSTTGATLATFNYTADGLLETMTDIYSNTLTIERLFDGTPTAIISADNHRTELTVDTNGYLNSIHNPANETHHIEYHPGGLMSLFTTPKGNSNTLTYDTMGRLLTDTNDEGGSWQLSNINLDEGYSVSMTSGEGRTDIFTVEPLTSGDVIQTRTARDGTESITERASNGVTVTTKANGMEYHIEEEANPRFGILSPEVNKIQITTPAGLTKVTEIQQAAILSSPGEPLSHTQLTKTVIINGNTATNVFDRAALTYTTTSPENRVSTSVVDNNGRVVQFSIPGLHSTNYNYDLRGRLNRIDVGTGVEQRTTIIDYNTDGFIQLIRNAEGQETTRGYDLAGRIIETQRDESHTTLFDYDTNGNLTAIEPPNNEPHQFDYTITDLRNSYTAPPVAGMLNTTTLSHYNLDKQVTESQRPDNQNISFDYHPTSGKLTKINLPLGQSLEPGYDPITGQLNSVTRSDGVILDYTYDGSLRTSETWSGPITGSVEKIYDNFFRVAERKINGGNTTVFSYDNDGLLTGAGSLILTRDIQNGLLTNATLDNIISSSGYNGFAELTGYSVDINTPQSTLYNATYTRDLLGRILNKTENISGASTSTDYTYDNLGRLATVNTQGSLTSYTYDANGNRTQVNGLPIANYDAQDRLNSYGTFNYTYTDNGELLTKVDTASNQTTRYTYDVLDNLLQVQLPDGRNIDYVVDGQNRRIAKKINGSIVQGFLYKDQLNPIAELDTSNAIIARFVYAGKSNVPAYMEKDGETYRIISDHLGSPRLVVNSTTGEIVQRMDYDAFGNITLDTNPGFQPFGFAGGLYDQDTQLTRFGARDYDPVTGRWTAKDPIGFAGKQTNLYTYVNNEPVNFIDPTGLASFSEARNQAMREVLEGIRRTGNEHACAVCCTPSMNPNDELDCTVGPIKEGSERSIQKQDLPECRYGFVEEYVHSHPANAPLISEEDGETGKNEGVPVTAVEPNGRGSTYTPGDTSVPIWDHNF